MKPSQKGADLKAEKRVNQLQCKWFDRFENVLPDGSRQWTFV